MADILQDASALREMLSVSNKKGVAPLTEQMLNAALVFMPINNKSDPTEHVGGGHWSLLVYRRATTESPARFEHYDSCKGANATHARGVAKCLIALLDPSVGGTTTQLMAMQTPQQARARGTRHAGMLIHQAVRDSAAYAESHTCH
eukprot:7380952-Prymnesium_polylepis.1